MAALTLAVGVNAHEITARTWQRCRFKDVSWLLAFVEAHVC